MSLIVNYTVPKSIQESVVGKFRLLGRQNFGNRKLMAMMSKLWIE